MLKKTILTFWPRKKISCSLVFCNWCEHILHEIALLWKILAWQGFDYDFTIEDCRWFNPISIGPQWPSRGGLRLISLDYPTHQSNRRGRFQHAMSIFNTGHWRYWCIVFWISTRTYVVRSGTAGTAGGSIIFFAIGANFSGTCSRIISTKMLSSLIYLCFLH